jgi:hypothetical protein
MIKHILLHGLCGRPSSITLTASVSPPVPWPSRGPVPGADSACRVLRENPYSAANSQPTPVPHAAGRAIARVGAARPTDARHPRGNSGPFGRCRPAAYPRSRADPAHRPRQLRRGLARPRRPGHLARRQDRPSPDFLARSPLRTRVQGHPTSFSWRVCPSWRTSGWWPR